METTCSVCNRPLTDPESMARGIGPTCFAKLLAIRPRHFQRDIYSPVFDYGVDEEKKIIWLEDACSPDARSLTNGMEQALQLVANETGISIADYRICYRDSEGRWDGVMLKGRRATFYPIGKKSRHEAVKYLHEITDKNQLKIPEEPPWEKEIIE